MDGSQEYRELLIGSGSRRQKVLTLGGPDWQNLTTLDINADHEPDVVWDLTVLPLPFETDSFNEIHAYEVLEHTGAQGDYKFFFAQFSEFWRVLRPDGLLCASVPGEGSTWIWGDPSHTRTIQKESLVFLDQSQYTRQVGVTPMSDFRYLYQADFSQELLVEQSGHLLFALKAIKPSRVTKPAR